jgi:hypothetical protein
MVHLISNVIKEYQDKPHEMPFVPKTSYQRDLLGYCGDANKTFLTFLFNNSVVGIQFLKDAGLIRRKVQFNTCCRDWCHVTFSCVSREHPAHGSASNDSGMRGQSPVTVLPPPSFPVAKFRWNNAVTDDCGPAAIVWPTFLQSFRTRFEKCWVIMRERFSSKIAELLEGGWQGTGRSEYRNVLWRVTTNMEATGGYVKEIGRVSGWGMTWYKLN